MKILSDNPKPAMPHPIKQRIDDLESEVRQLTAANRQLREELESARTEIKVLRSSLNYDRLPCGHSDQWAFSNDGGKTGICLLCNKDRLTLALDKAKEALICMGYALTHKDSNQSFAIAAGEDALAAIAQAREANL